MSSDNGTTIKTNFQTSALSIFDQLESAMNVRLMRLEGVRKTLIQCGQKAEIYTEHQLRTIAHTIRLKLINATDAEKQESEIWLRTRNLM